MTVPFEIGDHNSIDAVIHRHNTRQPAENRNDQAQNGGGQWLHANLQAAGNTAKPHRNASKAQCDGGKRERSNPEGADAQ
jgi:hypothetical protein